MQFTKSAKFMPWILLIVVVTVFLFLSNGANLNFYYRTGVMIAIFSILACSLNIALGFAGQINLGHIAFYGVGAYTSAILVKADYSFIIGLLAGGLVASLFGGVLTYITKKLSGDYFALATLGFSFVIYAIMLNWVNITNGPLGISGIPKPELGGFKIQTNLQYFVFSLVILLLTYLFFYFLTKSRYGRLLEALRDDEIGISVLGKNTLRLKIEAMMISAFFAGIAGSLFAHFIRFIDPSAFYLNDIVIILTIVIVGGLASLRGSVLAAIILVLVPEILRFVEVNPTIVGPMRQVIFASFLLIILLFLPKGLFGRVDLE